MEPQYLSLNTSRERVPTAIHKGLDSIVSIIHKHCDCSAMIWLFGSYARGDQINDSRIDSQGALSEYHSDLDILVVFNNHHWVKKTYVWQLIDADIAQDTSIGPRVHLITEYLPRFLEAVANSEFFYFDIVREGVVLDNIGLTLEQPKPLSPAQHRQYAVGYLEMFYQRALDSQQGFELYYQRGNYGPAIYCLHQMCERLFYTYLLVETHYKPRSHDLINLRTQAGSRDKAILTLIPQASKEQQTQWHFLNRAYVDSHYQLKYQVDLALLDTVASWVESFQRWLLPTCLKRIDGIIPEQNFSAGYEVPGDFLDLKKLKTTPLPEAVVEQQLMELKRKEAELKEKDKALKKERKEKERLRELLHKAGVDPGTDS